MRKIIRQTPIACAAVAMLAVAYYIIFPSRGYFHSDCTDTILWAQAACEARSFFNPDFTYAALFPFGGPLLMLPWVGLFGVSMAAHTLGMLVFLILLVAALAFFLHSLGWGARWIAAALAVFLPVLSLSDKSREIFWGHIIYYNLGLLFLFAGLGLLLRAWRLRSAAGAAARRAYWIWTAILLLLFMLGSTNGIQLILLFALPGVAAVFFQAYGEFSVPLRDPQHEEGHFLTLAMLLATVAGLLLGLALTGGIQSRYENGNTAFSDPATWFENIGKFLMHWVQLMGVQVKRGDPFFSVNGIMNLCKLLASLVILIVPPIMLVLYRKFADQRTRILLIAHAAMSGAVLFGYVFGVLASAGWRLTPVLGSSLLLTIVFARWIWSSARLRRLTALVLLPLALAAAIGVVGIARMDPDYNQDKGLNAIADYLGEQGLTYGYASFWNANAVTVLSDSAVKVRSVTLSEKEIKPYYYQSQRRWFDDQPGQARYFLLLTKSELEKKWPSLLAAQQNAEEQREFQNYVVLVYPDNLFPWTADAVR